jgi:hypothetical protein
MPLALGRYPPTNDREHLTVTSAFVIPNDRLTSTPDFAPDLDLCPLPAQSGRQRKKRLSFDMEHGAFRRNRHREERKG